MIVRTAVLAIAVATPAAGQSDVRILCDALVSVTETSTETLNEVGTTLIAQKLANSMNGVETDPMLQQSIDRSMAGIEEIGDVMREVGPICQSG